MSRQFSVAVRVSQKGMKAKGLTITGMSEGKRGHESVGRLIHEDGEREDGRKAV